MESRRLYRSTKDRVVGGVAGGLASSFNMNPLLVRLLFVIFTLIGGGAVIIYIVLWIVTPDNPDEVSQTLNQPNMEPTDNQEKPVHETRHKGNLIGGLVLIALGAIFLADQFIPRIDFGDLWPVILIVIGIALLINAFGRGGKKNDKNIES